MKSMNNLDQLKQEFLRELQGTKKLLEALPADQMGYKPHEKSMSILAMATHIVDLTGWPAHVLKGDSLDLAGSYKSPKYESKEDLLKGLEELSAQVEKAINEANDDELSKNFVLKSGDYVIMESPKSDVIRFIVNNHIYHHRGQLTVYLRLLDLPVPGLYGPSADDKK